MALEHLADMLKKQEEERRQDEKAFDNLREDQCMICHAEGPDMRDLEVDCFYRIKEVVPEMLDLTRMEGMGSWYARICKGCRGVLLGKMKEWRDERVAVRDLPKDSDGEVEEENGKNIPVRIHGRIVMMSEDEYYKWRENEGLR